MRYEDELRLSNRTVVMVQVLFAVALGQSLIILKDVVTAPLKHPTAFVALSIVYMTTIWSWIDWHGLMQEMPYQLLSNKTVHFFKSQIAVKHFERFRILPDVLIVAMYVYLALTIIPFASNSYGNMLYHLLGYLIIFGLYIVAGLMRRTVYGRHASRVYVHFVALMLTGVVCFDYWLLVGKGNTTIWLNILTLLLTMSIMLWYRFKMLPRAREIRIEIKENAIRIGIDIDGVLADQIPGVLEHINQDYGIQMQKEDIKRWDEPVNGVSNIKIEIENSMKDPDYILDMPVYPGARNFLQSFSRLNKIVLVTSRPRYSKEHTRRWLRLNALTNDEIIFTNAAGKALCDVKVLIDDYLGNIEYFLSNTNGIAFLIDQPWNRDRTTVQPWLENGRLNICSDLISLSKQLSNSLPTRRDSGW